MEAIAWQSEDPNSIPGLDPIQSLPFSTLTIEHIYSLFSDTQIALG